ncbi:MAG: GntR family transcriptional regulator [Gammaproteobacteria bacterium]|jgi:GntR family transcriptional regulator|nr:hypothetical protein [Chromatiales bacterium]MDP6675806.1 GntR family transcriptional regulator [Gammaproteobacteria bacterium]
MEQAQKLEGRRKAGSEDRTVTPLYHQVYIVLREKILASVYAPDLPLPGEHQLAEEFGVSRVTIRRTLKNLELDGLVDRRRGIGTFPVTGLRVIRDRYNIDGMLDPGKFRDAPAKISTRSVQLINSPAHISRQLNDTQQVLRINRVRTVKQEPFTQLTIYLPKNIADQLDSNLIKKKAALVVLEEAGFYMTRTEQSISAKAADDVSALLLEVPVGSPLISMSAIFFDHNDEPLAIMEGLFRPDLYEYKTTAIRHGTGKSAHWTTQHIIG